MIDKLNKENIEYIENASLKNYNTFKIESKCKCLIMPSSIIELIYVVKLLNKDNEKYFLLGNGSNIVFEEDFLPYYVILLTKLNNITIHDDEVECSCGVMLPVLVKTCLENDLTGLEWASGIPGTVGASIYNNAGAYKGEIKDNLIKVDVLYKDGKFKTINKKDLSFGYRTSIFKEKKDCIILKAYFKLEKGNIEESKELIKDRFNKRKESQPLEYPSAGSVFRNPENNYAGALIEQSGLKGFNCGDAYVSEKHANFIVNKGNATGKDIVKLINIVKDTIKKDHNIDLILEQEIIK